MESKEERIQLALEALRKGQISSVRKAAGIYDVPHTTLHYRLHGRKTLGDAGEERQKLTPAEERALIDWILSLDARGHPPRVGRVREMAIYILKNSRVGSPITSTIGEKWVNRFAKRHSDVLQSRFSRKFDYQRARCEDRGVICEWFELVRETIKKYEINEDDIYNFDETGFQMGIISSTRVVTGSEKRGRPKVVQAGNRDWVTVVEGIGATGRRLPPMVIFKGKLQQAGWYNEQVAKLLPQGSMVGASDNGWTNNELGLKWLKEIFDKHTRPVTSGRYRLLILDSHASHTSAEFDKYCSDNGIIALYLPAHSSHFLQPLDVSCFSPLKSLYKAQVQSLSENGVNHIQKETFLLHYAQIRDKALREDNIRSGFEAVGLVPYNPDRVLSKIPDAKEVPSPPGTSDSNRSFPSVCTPRTPYDVRQLKQQKKESVDTVRNSARQPSNSQVGGQTNKGMRRSHDEESRA